MTTPLVDGDIVLARIECFQNSQTSICDLHYRVSGSVGLGGTDLDAAVAIDAVFAPLFKAVISNNTSYVGTRLSRIWPNPTPSFLYAVNTGGGTGGPESVPTQVAGVITKNTGIIGRKYRGRIYMPFPATAGVLANGTMSGAQIIAYNAVAAQMIPSIGSGGLGNFNSLDPVLYHRSTHTGTILTAAFCTADWGTQRKRGDYGRPNSP